MEIKIGTTDINVPDPTEADDYGRIIQAVTRSLFLISGIKRNDEQVAALGHNLHRFLIENKDFVIGVVNAGRIKS